MTKTLALEIIETLKTLPPEKIAEVRDFALFLREQHNKTQNIDYSDEWTDEDMRDVTTASLRYADEFENEDEQ